MSEERKLKPLNLFRLAETSNRPQSNCRQPKPNTRNATWIPDVNHGVAFCITGTLNLKRADIMSILYSVNAVVHKDMRYYWQIDFLVKGASTRIKSSVKETIARARSIPIITEAQLWDFIHFRGGEIPEKIQRLREDGTL